MGSCTLTFNGERPDPVSGMTPLGNGYRAYNPVLQRFNAPDSLSPFGAGGLNTYAYCDGDPVNHADPSGHLSGQAWFGIGMGALGIAMAVFTAGTSIAAAGGLMAAVESASVMSLVTGAAGVLSDVAAIASGAAEGSHPQASAALGWVSLGLGIVGMIKGASGLAGRPGRPFSRLMMGERRRFATGEFHNPVFLGVSPQSTPGIDFLYEDTTVLGIRRLNIVTQTELNYGIRPTLPVNMWNEAQGTTELVQYSPAPGSTSALDALLIRADGEPYPIYRFGSSYAANRWGAIGTAQDRYPLSFAVQFSNRMPNSRILIARGRVHFSGGAFESIRNATADALLSGQVINPANGQCFLNDVVRFWNGYAGVFEMTSEGWSTYFNGRCYYGASGRAV